MQNMMLSTETMMLISLLGKKMPNLINTIIQHSTPKTSKSPTTPPKKVLSPRQIQEACRHPSAIVAQTLDAVMAVQNAINVTNAKINELTKQRTIIENTLVTLLSINNQEPG